MHEEKEKIEQKKVALVAKIFCSHVYSTDLIRHIRRTKELWRKKKKTVSFQQLLKSPMVTRITDELANRKSSTGN